MLQKHLALLKMVIDKMANLGNSDVSWADYFATVWYEILTVLLGAAYVVVIAGILVVPYAGCRWIWRRRESDEYDKHILDLEEYSEFRQQYSNLRYNLTYGKKRNLAETYERLLTLLNSKHVPYTRVDITKVNVDEEIERLPYMSYVSSIDDLSSLASETTESELGDFAVIFRPETYGKYNSFKNMRFKSVGCKVCKTVLLVLSYLIVVIPLILMLF